MRIGAAETLIGILSSEEELLTDLSARFGNSFDFSDRINALTGTSLLLADGLLDHHQQFVAAWLLFSEYEVSSIQDHPFYCIFTMLHESLFTDPNFCSPQLHDLIQCILKGVNIDSVITQNIFTIFSNGFVFPAASVGRTLISESPDTERVSPIIFTEIDEPDRPCMTHNEILIQVLQDEAFWSSFEPPYIRHIPDLSPIFPGEPQIVQSFDMPPFLFDEGVTVDSRGAALTLITKATETKLKSGESDSLINELKKDPSLAEEAKISPSKISTLVENNSEVAKEIIVILSPKKPSIVKALLALDVTAASIDVVKHFLISEKTPESFLEDYLTNVIKVISAVRDNQTMGRKARMLCKMMGFVLQNGYQLSDSMCIDLHSFCIDPRIKSLKEAQELDNILSK